jgi:hypothetical protein
MRCSIDLMRCGCCNAIDHSYALHVYSIAGIAKVLTREQR